MIAITISGAAGRMGRTLIQTVHETPGLAMVGALERAGVTQLGQDAGELAGIGRLGVTLTDDASAALRGCAKKRA